MNSDDHTLPIPRPPSPPEGTQGLDPAELLKRALQSDPATGTAKGWTPPAPEELARLLPQYQIESLLGRGGMGAVYKGRQTGLDRPVAIKLLPSEMAADAQFVTRFQREARTLARLQHPGIVAVHDFGQTSEEHLYFVMEFVDGTDLAHIIHGVGLEPPQVLEVITQICDALQYAHTLGVIHRDIKPANVLLTKDGRAKLADFGLARPLQEDSGALTGSDVVMGTPDYIAPEQMTGHADHRADLYSLGVMLYEMLTGQPPRGAFTPVSQRVQVDVRLDQVVLRALQQEPERRYQQASEMKTDVDTIRSSPMQRAAKPGEKSKSARRGRLALAAIVLLPILAIAGWFVWQKVGHKTAALPAISPSPSLSVSSTPATATQASPFINTLGMKFVPVPITGGPTSGQGVLFSVWETRVQDYEVFAKETKREWSKPDFEQGPTHPAVNVSWEDATAFCAWLTEREQKDGRLGAKEAYRLPSDHEWSCAVGIGQREDAAKSPGEKDRKLADVFPWGNQWPPPPGAGNYKGEEGASGTSVNTQMLLKDYRDGCSATAPVATYPASQFGLFDLGGNVWEWCADWFDRGKDTHVQRGAGFRFSSHDFLLSSYRGYTTSGYNANAGFRVVLARSPEKGDGVVGTERITSATATKEAPFVNTLGMKFVPVPITGGPTDGQRVLFSVWETRVQDYEAFAKETQRPWPKPDFEQGATHPAVNVRWEDAQAFCVWLTERERKAGNLGVNEVYRLPSDHEWSCAAGIGHLEDPAKLPSEKNATLKGAWPWGIKWPPPPGVGNFAGEELKAAKVAGKHDNIDGALSGYRDDYVETAPVGSFPPERIGLYDLAGNVREWCEDWFDASKKDPVLRGGAWVSFVGDNLLSSYRNFWSLGSAPSPHYGFRCVLASSTPSAATSAKAVWNKMPLDAEYAAQATSGNCAIWNSVVSACVMRIYRGWPA